MIEAEVGVVLEPSALPEWWSTYIPALGCTPRVAYDRGDGEKVFIYVQTYTADWFS
jgi:hypothetical protein